jgi:hypothetical protein
MDRDAVEVELHRGKPVVIPSEPILRRGAADELDPQGDRRVKRLHGGDERIGRLEVNLNLKECRRGSRERDLPAGNDAHPVKRWRRALSWQGSLRDADAARCGLHHDVRRGELRHLPQERNHLVERVAEDLGRRYGRGGIDLKIDDGHG